MPQQRTGAHRAMTRSIVACGTCIPGVWPPVQAARIGSRSGLSRYQESADPGRHATGDPPEVESANGDRVSPWLRVPASNKWGLYDA